jgi:hypothetical protein
LISICTFLLAAAPAGLAGDTVCFEAEALEGITEPMEVVDAAKMPSDDVSKAVQGASGDKYLQIAIGKGKAPKVTCQAGFAFEVEKEGTYYLWGRVWWDGECSNSFFMTLDDGLPFVFGEDATYNAWHWVKAPPRLKQLNLSKGKHKLTIKNREDGVRLDEILLVLDKNYVPVAIETATVASSLSDQKDDSTK